MVGSFSEDFDLLKAVLPSIHEAVATLNKDTPEAQSARQSVNDTAKGGLVDSFHATVESNIEILLLILARLNTAPTTQGSQISRLLSSLEDVLRNSSSHGEMTCLKGIQTSQFCYAEVTEAFRCPKPRFRQKLEKRLDTCINSLATVRETRSFLEWWEPMPEWRPASKHCSDWEDIYESLRNHQLECGCAHQHELKLSFATPCSNTPRFLLHLQRDERSSLMANVTLQTLQRKTGAKVTFDVDDDPELIAADMRQLNDCLSTLCEADGDSINLVALRGAEKLYYKRNLPHEIPHSRPILTSLREGSRILQGMARESKLTIALLTAYAYLGLSGSDCWSEMSTELDLWFMIVEDQAGRTTLQPFLRLNYEDIDEIPNNYTAASCMWPARPSLPALGKLLLEIAVGRPLSWDKGLNAAIEEVKKGHLSDHYAVVVEGCLRPAPELRQTGTLGKEARKIFLDRVIKGIQYLLWTMGHRTLDKIVANLSFGEQPQEREPLSVTENHWTELKSSSIEVTRSWRSVQSVEKKASRSNKTFLPSRSRSNDFDEWMGKWNERVTPLSFQHSGPRTRPPRVAIVDTGVNVHSRWRKISSSGIRDYWSWCEVPGGCSGQQVLDDVSLSGSPDNDGHGTHLMSTFMSIAPGSEVYIAKVFESREEMKEDMPDAIMSLRIANAIYHAVNKWEVDIISMSFGFPEEVPAINKAIDQVCRKVLLFAAASNEGGNEPIRWPASHPNVICMHAAYGKGTIYPNNPTASNDKNLAILGCDVTAWTPSGMITRSGTSQATIIAAAVASLVIDLCDGETEGYINLIKTMEGAQYDENTARQRHTMELEKLRRYETMIAIFRSMARNEKRGDYLYITPWTVLKKNRLAAVYELLATLKT